MPVKQMSRRVLHLALPFGLITTGVLLSLISPAAARFGILTTQDPNAWVNVRSAPSIDATPIQQGTPGDRVEVLRETQSADGFTWYLVRFTNSRIQGWVRGDLVSLTRTAPQSSGNAQIAPSLQDASNAANSRVNGTDPWADSPFPEYRPRPVEQAAVIRSASQVSPAQISAFQVDTNATSDFTESFPENFAQSGRAPAAIAPQPFPPTPQTANSWAVPPGSQPRELVFETANPTAVQPIEQPYMPQPMVRSQVAPAPQVAYVRPQPPVQRGGFTQAQIQYFMEVAMGSEYGSGGGTIRKWTQPVRIRIHGNPSPQDLSTVSAVVSELQELTGLDIQLTRQAGNIDMHFAPEPQFRSIESNYRPTNMGFFWVWWDANGSINRARILISTTGVTQTERSHLIREELTQSMGLMRDSNRYRDSIFYQGWTATTEYSELDRAVISMLYHPAVRPGMNQAQVVAVLTDGRSASVCENNIPIVGGLLEGVCNFIVN